MTQTTPGASLNHIRAGEGKPLLLLHGLGGSWRSWSPILPALAGEREIVAVDLPGFGATPSLAGKTTIGSLAAALSAFLAEQGLIGIDVVGSSLGARLALELARQGVVGATVALDPGGFWVGWERSYFHASIKASIALVRALQPIMPQLSANPITRSLLFAQFSARPWDLAPAVVLTEMRSYAASPAFDQLLDELALGAPQQGMPDAGRGPVTLVWGRQDRVCLPAQAKRALALFPHARLIWFESCGHFPQWDLPQSTARLILTETG